MPIASCHKRFSCYAQVFEKGNFAGLEEMKRNDRLFNKIAPIGVSDIMMAVQYQHAPLPPLDLPITSFDGQDDATIERGNMQEWKQYTAGAFMNIPIDGDHYFVSKRYRKVSTTLINCVLLAIHKCFMNQSLAKLCNCKVLTC